MNNGKRRNRTIHGCQPSLRHSTTQQRHPIARWHHICVSQIKNTAMQQTPLHRNASKRRSTYTLKNIQDMRSLIPNKLCDETRPPSARAFWIIAITAILVITGCTGASKRGKWLEIANTGQLINLDLVTDIIPGRKPGEVRFMDNGSGEIRFFSPTVTPVEFPSQKAANEGYQRIIEFLKSNDHYLQL